MSEMAAAIERLKDGRARQAVRVERVAMQEGGLRSSAPLRGHGKPTKGERAMVDRHEPLGGARCCLRNASPLTPARLMRVGLRGS
jgi:hypothetical protein